MGAAASVTDSPVPLLVTSPKCAWLQTGAGGISLNLRGKQYKLDQGRGRGVCFGPASEAAMFIADGSIHSMAVRVADDRELALEVNHRKFEKGNALSVWFTKGHPEWALRFTLNADRSLSPLDNTGKLVQHLVVGIKKGANEVILVGKDDADQKIVFEFGDNMSARLSEVAEAKKLAKEQLKEMQNFPLLLLSPPCISAGPGMKALYVDEHQWQKKKSGHVERGRTVAIGLARDATYFSADGMSPSSVALRVHKDDGLALNINYNKIKEGQRLGVYDPGQNRWANTFCINYSDGTVSPIDTRTKLPAKLVLGVEGKNMAVILVPRTDTSRRIVLALGQSLRNFRDAMLAQKLRQDEARKTLRLKAERYLTPSLLNQLREDGFVRITGIVPQELVSRAKGEINRMLGQATSVDKFKAKSFPKDPAITDLFNRSGIPYVVGKLLGISNPRQYAGQIALRFPGDACPGNALRCPPAHFNTTRKYWHIDGCPNKFIPGVTDHFGKVANFDALVGVLLSDVPEKYSGELCCYPGSHMALAEYFSKRGRMQALRQKGDSELPRGDQTDTLFKRPCVNCIGKAGDVFLANYMTAHFIAPNSSANIRYAVYFRVSGPSFSGKTHNPAPMLAPWRNWPLVHGTGGGKTPPIPVEEGTAEEKDGGVSIDTIAAIKRLSMHYAASNNDHLSFKPPSLPTAGAASAVSGQTSGPWVCSQCTFNHTEESQRQYLSCVICGADRT